MSYLVSSCEVLLDLVPGLIRGNKKGELELGFVQLVIEVLLLPKIEGFAEMIIKYLLY